ncbi:MAG: isochorismatase family protein [Alphaproteobacteria bacterium]|nr:isochorismatase family protein [Alphaproteobacteria bacterium]
MIKMFDENTALLLIDVQEGVDVLDYWGGSNGRRNNPDAEKNMLMLLSEWRERKRTVAFTTHDSKEVNSPLKLSLETGKQKSGFEIFANEIVVTKDVNSGFIGTSLEVQLRRARINRLVIVGFFTNFCVDTTVRMSGNLGFDTYLVHDCCATTNRIGLNGEDYEPQLVHDLTIGNLHGEFCTAITTEDALGLLTNNAEHIERVQGNEPVRVK